MYILLKATHRPTKIGTPIGVIELDRGQYISGRHKLSAAVGLSEREIRTCVARLEELDILSVKTTNRFSIYTIVNYNNYQDGDQQSDQQTTNKRPTNDQQTTTKQEAISITNIKEENHIAIGKPNCQHTEVINLYHELLPASPRIKDWTPARAATLKARWNESADRQNLEYWKALFEYIAGIPFLTGRVAGNGRKPFVCSLDWLLKAENFAKVREGRYEDQHERA